MHQMMSCSREVGAETINQFGADFRYAVEFSKYGRAPLEVSRPPTGQPDLRYRFGSTTPNRRCLTDTRLPSATRASSPPLLRRWIVGLSPGPSSCRGPVRSGRCAVPLGA